MNNYQNNTGILASKISNLIFGISILLMMFFYNSCTNKSICLQPQTVSLRSGFYYSVSDTSISLKDSFLTNSNFYFGNDTLYYYNLKNSNKINTALSSVSDSTVYFFQSDSSNLSFETIDTIHLYHSNSLNFISVACGYQFFHTIKNVTYTKHVIDTIFINQPSINSDVNQEHLKIVLQN